MGCGEDMVVVDKGAPAELSPSVHQGDLNIGYYVAMLVCDCDVGAVCAHMQYVSCVRVLQLC